MNAREIVLVVDDAPSTLGLLNDTLEQAGYTVLVAQSGAAALDLIERVTPDIVLLDAIMPGIDGFEACRRMKSVPAMAGTPIVFMTGLSETEHVIKGLDAGGVDYVAKPVAPNEVVARVRVHLANARLTRSAQVALDAAGRFLLAMDRSGRVLWCTPQAARLLQTDGAGPDIGMPAEVVDWALAGAALPAAVRAPMVCPLNPAAPPLELTYIGQIGPDELLLRVVAADPTSDTALLRERFGLTAREAEVLLWLGRGKPNRDIAEILGLSPRTVNKHLEQIYAKLGVENRASATALATRAIQGQ